MVHIRYKDIKTQIIIAVIYDIKYITVQPVSTTAEPQAAANNLDGSDYLSRFGHHPGRGNAT